MLEWFRKRKQPNNENKILNDGVDFAMEFGSNWLQPIQSRLSKLYPELSDAELDCFNSKCKLAMTAGHDLVYEMSRKFGNELSFDVFLEEYSKSFPLVNDKNLKHLFSQGMYYVCKG